MLIGYAFAYSKLKKRQKTKKNSLTLPFWRKGDIQKKVLSYVYMILIFIYLLLSFKRSNRNFWFLNAVKARFALRRLSFSNAKGLQFTAL